MYWYQLVSWWHRLCHRLWVERGRRSPVPNQTQSWRVYASGPRHTARHRGQSRLGLHGSWKERPGETLYLAQSFRGKSKEAWVRWYRLVTRARRKDSRDARTSEEERIQEMRANMRASSLPRQGHSRYQHNLSGNALVSGVKKRAYLLASLESFLLHSSLHLLNPFFLLGWPACTTTRTFDGLLARICLGDNNNRLDISADSPPSGWEYSYIPGGWEYSHPDGDLARYIWWFSGFRFSPESNKCKL